MIAVANAPVSYGAFELTVGINPYVPDGESILDLVQNAGYRGIDLGPVGYFGVGDALARNLEKRQLGLAGGYLEIPFHDDEAMARSRVELDEMLDVFDVARPVNYRLGVPAPCPTIAVMSLPYRRGVPGRSVTDRSLGYTHDQWTTFARNAEGVAVACRERGYRAVFHNETGTNVEAPWEFARVVELTSFDLCLDTGHLIVGGGDPVEFLREHADRIAHLHLKSAHINRLQALIADGSPVEAIWEKRIFCALGEGDLDMPGMSQAIKEVGYDGWIVVEQDIFPDATSLVSAQEDQIRNRNELRSLGY